MPAHLDQERQVGLSPVIGRCHAKQVFGLPRQAHAPTKSLRAAFCARLSSNIWPTPQCWNLCGSKDPLKKYPSA